MDHSYIHHELSKEMVVTALDCGFEIVEGKESICRTNSVQRGQFLRTINTFLGVSTNLAAFGLSQASLT
jgi:hypothetical protein